MIAGGVITVETQREWLRRCFTQEGLKELRGLTSGPGWTQVALSKDAQGRTPLHIVADYGWADAVRLLLEHRADTLPRDVRGNTAAHLAAVSGVHGSVLKGLCFTTDTAKKNRVLDGANDDGNSPLHLAVAHRNAPGAQNLLDLHCNPFLTNRAGETALCLAERAQAPELIEAVQRGQRHYLTSVALLALCGVVVSDATKWRSKRVHFDVTPAALTARAKDLASSERVRRTTSSATPSSSKSPRSYLGDESLGDEEQNSLTTREMLSETMWSNANSNFNSFRSSQDTVGLPYAFSFLHAAAAERRRRRSEDFAGEAAVFDFSAAHSHSSGGTHVPPTEPSAELSAELVAMTMSRGSG
eukprot:TRINITY_DN11534_c0_g1_i1.p1 TRINITY_DN11534_c0_g1~~TRINITY_DN11534_c0_g1_i1.p1  ORF type:complete len:357 (+),score=111.25 TRINITY_DN11534_c0_g1_i1:1318-2388(+)